MSLDRSENHPSACEGPEGAQPCLIVVGASAGGVDALLALCRGLPADLDAAVLVVVHIGDSSPGYLAEALDRAGPVPAREAREGDAIRAGRILVAPPDRHLLVFRDGIQVSRGPRENSTRPAIDPLFRSAAASYGRHVIGVILSGTLSDGTRGLLDIKRCGGISVVQDPTDATFPGMPESALAHVDVDHCVPLEQMAALLARLSRGAAGPAKSVPSDVSLAVRMYRVEANPMAVQTPEGEADIQLSCPECGGPMQDVQQGTLRQFRCTVGHALTQDSMLSAQSDAIERALWAAIRLQKEKIALYRRLENDATEQHHGSSVKRYEEAIHELEEHVAVLQEVLERSLDAKSYETTLRTEQKSRVQSPTT